MEEGDDKCFRVFDATGFMIVAVSHREDLHAKQFPGHEGYHNREAARRIAKAISRLPDLLRRLPD